MLNCNKLQAHEIDYKGIICITSMTCSGKSLSTKRKIVNLLRASKSVLVIYTTISFGNQALVDHSQQEYGLEFEGEYEQFMINPNFSKITITKDSIISSLKIIKNSKVSFDYIFIESADYLVNILSENNISFDRFLKKLPNKRSQKNIILIGQLFYKQFLNKAIDRIYIGTNCANCLDDIANLLLMDKVQKDKLAKLSLGEYLMCDNSILN